MTDSKRNEEKTGTKEKIWFGVSLLLTFVILGWTFTTAIRATSAKPKKSTVVVTNASMEQEHVSPEEFRARAVADDAEFMRQIEDIRRRNKAKKPDNADARRVWDRKVRSMIVEQPLPKDSVEWGHQQSLRKLMDDAPSEK